MRWLWITCWWSKKISFFQFNDFFVWWFSSMVCAVEWNCGSYNASTERGTAWLSVQGQIPPSKRCCSRWCHCKGHRARHGGSFAAVPFFEVKFCVKSFLDSDGVWIWLQFTKEDGKAVEEFKLRVVYIPANPPSPVPEGSEEGSSPRAFSQENGNHHNSSFDDVRVS